MANGKVTLAELRKEAERVGAGTNIHEHSVHGLQSWFRVAYIEVTAGSRNGARRRMLKLLRALPDGALKEG